MPPPTMQYKPRDIRAASLLHEGQFKGSFFESWGCGSRIMVPSAVFFFPSDDDRRDMGFGEEMLGCGGNEEPDVVGGVLRRPRGSLCSWERRRTEPRRLCQYIGFVCGRLDLPGTSYVRGSFSIPILHFTGFAISSCAGTSSPVSLPIEVEFLLGEDIDGSEWGVRAALSGWLLLAILSF